MQFYIVIELLFDILLIWAYIDINDPSTKFLVSQTIFFTQLTGVMIFVLTKHPEDCFACFNQMDGSKRNYSTFQYPVEEQDQKKDTYSRMIREQIEQVRRGSSETPQKGQESDIGEIRRQRQSIDNDIVNRAAALPAVDGNEENEEFNASVGSEYYHRLLEKS
jgi:hypothetical protein